MDWNDSFAVTKSLMPNEFVQQSVNMRSCYLMRSNSSSRKQHIFKNVDLLLFYFSSVLCQKLPEFLLIQSFFRGDLKCQGADSVKLLYWLEKGFQGLLATGKTHTANTLTRNKNTLSIGEKIMSHNYNLNFLYSPLNPSDLNETWYMS